MRCHASAALLSAALAAGGLAGGGGGPPAPSPPPGGGPPGPSSGQLPTRRRVRSECSPELGLVTEDETAVSYARNARVFCNTSSPWAERHGGVHSVLAFVAPWHDHGYRAARYFRRKLSAVSPLWFKVMPARSGDGFELAGRHFAAEQTQWAKQVVEICETGGTGPGTAGGCQEGPRLLPSLSFEGFDRLDVLRRLLEEPAELAVQVALLCEQSQYQGIVLDVRLALFPSLTPLLPRVVAVLSHALRASARDLLLSVPAAPAAPSGSRGAAFDSVLAGQMSKNVVGVIVGTRDFSKAEVGPAAPLPWVRSSLTRLLAGGEEGAGLRPDQLYLEIPLYGRAFKEGHEGGQIIQTKEIIKALAREKPKLVWEAESAEHSAQLSKGVSLSLPTLAFVEKRLRLAKSMGIGVALRELGAEFDAALDLFPARHAASSPAVASDLGEEAGGGGGAARAGAAGATAARAAAASTAAAGGEL